MAGKEEEERAVVYTWSLANELESHEHSAELKH